MLTQSVSVFIFVLWFYLRVPSEWKIGRIQGGYAKGSGAYEYEAMSKEKSSSKSGAAVVPVCLPLCCAMPCTIM